MITCIIAASSIAILSFFCFFTGAYSNIPNSMIPNMLQIMFGFGKGEVSGYPIKYKQYGGMTFLFILQIAIMIAAVICLFLCYKAKTDYGDEKTILIAGGIMGGMSLIAMILSFCTKQLSDSNGSKVHLGFGPIAYSILHIVVILLLAIGAVKWLRENGMGYGRRRGGYKSYGQRPYGGQTMSSQNRPLSSGKQELTENEKSDLILKYKKMFDDGVITKEEFEKKKKELL